MLRLWQDGGEGGILRYWVTGQGHPQCAYIRNPLVPDSLSGSEHTVSWYFLSDPAGRVKSLRLSKAENGVGRPVKIRISFLGNMPLQDDPTGASRQLCDVVGHLHDLNGFRANQLSVQELRGEMANLTHLHELLLDGANSNGISVNDPIVTEVAECDRLVAGFSTGHERRDANRSTKNRVIVMVPDIITVRVLEGMLMKNV